MFVPSLVIRVVSLIVPAARRERWRAEWRAELEHARRVANERAALVRIRLALRAIESVTDALWLRWRDVGGAGPTATLRDATRGLVRRPGYALAVIGTLALGMGSATAIFTVVDALLVRPIPFHEPDRLVVLSGPRAYASLDPEALREWRSQERVFTDVRAYRPTSRFVVTGVGETRIHLGWRVEPGFLGLLGIRPVLGRGLTPGDAQPGAERVVLLSDELWGAIGRDRDVIGRAVELDGEPHTVIGVLPPALRRLPVGIVYMVLPLSDGSTGSVMAMGRLRPEMSLETAQAHLDDVARVLSDERPREVGWDVTLTHLARGDRPAVRNGLLALGGGVLCLLLIACANAAGLLLLRGVSRRHELGLRLALGASRVSLLIRVLAESILLALAAGVLGTLLAWWLVRGLVALLPSGVVRFSYTVIGIDARVLLCAFGLTLLTGLVFGTLPAWRAARTTLARTGRTATSSREEVRLRAGMQVVQLALALLLLAGAGLFGQSFLHLMSVPLGYDVDHVLRLDVVSLERLRGRDATTAFARALDERLRAVPGVLGVSRAGGTWYVFDYTIRTQDRELRKSGSEMLLHLRVDTAYFRVMGIPILEGRAFGPEDLSPAAGSVIIDRDLAAALWPGRSAAGRSFRIRDDPWLRVVGVTGDVKLEGPHDPSGPYLFFYPASREELRSATVLLRTAGDPRELVPAVRGVVRDLDPERPIERLETGRQALGDSVADPRLFLVVMSALAALALTLAAVGVYGLVSFVVEQRRREIGIRVALGAQAGRVVGDVVRWGLLLGAVGVVIGVLTTAVLSRFVSAILFDTSPLDPAVLGLAAVTLLATCAVALVRPAARAAATDPAEVLRAE